MLLDDLLRDGYSERAIAQHTGLTRYQVRKHAVCTCARSVASRRTICKICGVKLKKTLQQARVSGKYICNACNVRAGHKYQIAKVGCTEEQYKTLLKKQNGCCAICRAVTGHHSKNGKTCHLAVDHDHRTGKVRGLLCNSCNRGLGRFKDDVLLLRKAAHYLEEAV